MIWTPGLTRKDSGNWIDGRRKKTKKNYGTRKFSRWKRIKELLWKENHRICSMVMVMVVVMLFKKMMDRKRVTKIQLL
jgi:hypothetical protein